MEGNVYVPNQEVRVRRFYDAIYKHDTTAPTCWWINYYNDEELSQSFDYSGGWLNQPKYFTMTCSDLDSGCVCNKDSDAWPIDENCIVDSGKVLSVPQLLWHKIRPSVSFTNTVGLNNPACSPGWAFPEILFDEKSPLFDITIDWEAFDLDIKSLRVYDLNWDDKKFDGEEIPGITRFTRTWSVNQLAKAKDIFLDIEDSYLEWSVNGVSWLKEYSLSVVRKTDRLFNNIDNYEITDCGISKVYDSQYNPSWNIEFSDTSEESILCSAFQDAGEYEILVSAEDWAGNIIESSSVFKVFPEDLSIGDSLFSVSSNWNVYANNRSVYTYTIDLRDRFLNPIPNINFNWVKHSLETYSNGKEILTESWNNALIVTTENLTSDNIWRLTFDVKSLKPWTFTQQFELVYDTWDKDYLQNWAENKLFARNISDNSFLSPFTWNLNVVGPGDKPSIGTYQTYQINIANPWAIVSSDIFSNWAIDLSQNSITFEDSHYFEVFNTIDSNFSLNNPICGFNGTINASDENSALISPNIEINNMNISYLLWGEEIIYPLAWISLDGCNAIGTLGLKVVGALQWVWKSQISWQDSNFSDLSASAFRNKIRENALNLVRWMSSWDTVNGIRYIEWQDISISWEQWYETLIVRNGNVVITDEGLNKGTSKKLGIIVIRDTWYDVKSDYDSTGNIFVNKDVAEIYASIYADGTLRSADSSGNSYADSDLGKQLYLKWALFTRNTIWGAVSSWTDLVLPGWETTSDIDLAKIYDLNYIRKSQLCWLDNHSFLIEADSKFQLDPPKWFSQ